MTTSAIVSFSSTSAVVTGNVIYGQNGVNLIGSGICWSTSNNPTTADSKTVNATYSGIFTSNLTGLTPKTTYFVRAYAVYNTGTTEYGNQLSFTTGAWTQKVDYPGGQDTVQPAFLLATKHFLGLVLMMATGPREIFGNGIKRLMSGQEKPTILEKLKEMP